MKEEKINEVFEFLFDFAILSIYFMSDFIESFEEVSPSSSFVLHTDWMNYVASCVKINLYDSLAPLSIIEFEPTLQQWLFWYMIYISLQCMVFAIGIIFHLIHYRDRYMLAT